MNMKKNNTKRRHFLPVRLMAFILSLCLCVMPAPIWAYAKAAPASAQNPAAPAITAADAQGDEITVEWTAENADGYQIQTAGRKSFKDAKSRYVRASSPASLKIGAPAAESGVYIRVRSYRLAGGKKRYSSWSAPVLVTKWNPGWKYASNSKIHSGRAVLYFSSAGMKGRTVCVNAGHGTKGGTSQSTLCHPDGTAKATGGSTAAGSKYAAAVSAGTTLAGGVPEAEANLKVARMLKEKLLDEGINVLMIRDGADVQLDNVARTVLANHYADCHVSVHFDSTDSDKGAFCIIPANIASYRAISPVRSHWREHVALAESAVEGLKSAGVKLFGNGTMGMDLTQISYSRIPSIDAEVGDRATALTDKALDAIAEGLADGICAYLDASE